MQRILTGGLACLAVPIGALAQTVTTEAPTKAVLGQVAGTNFPALADYPSPACIKAGALPKKPTDHRDAMAVDVYNAKLATYNAHVHDYVVCVNAYVRNADGDMDLIRKKSRDAVEEANR
jgi:hypothetical protein